MSVYGCVGIEKNAIPHMPFSITSKFPVEMGFHRMAASIVTLMIVSDPVFHGG
jgi:hypothetical protein